MLKFLLFVVGLMIISMLKKGWHVLHTGMFTLAFMFIGEVVSGSFSGSFGFGLGADVISYGLVLLSIWVSALMIMASQGVLKVDYLANLFTLVVLFLMLFLMLTFLTMNLFMFYLYFEASLIPTLLLILGWGYQPERLQAGLYLLFYTLIASLPLLIGIFYIYSSWGCLFMGLLEVSHVGLFFYLAMVMAFLVKMPMFLVHLWLPKAHVEAPVSGSMILAGVLLKLGGYGLLRLMPMLTKAGLQYNILWMGVSLYGGFLVSLMCLRQTDLKALVAYSSVAHMGLVLGGILTMSSWGVCGAYVLMIAHGLCSSGLFCLVNMTYERLGSRSLVVNKGLMIFMPSMAMWWFLLSAANMAAPPSLNLLGEIMILNSLVGWCWVTMFSIMLISFFSAAYTLYMFSYSQHGKFYSGLFSYTGGYTREYLLLMMHWLPLNLFILKSEGLVLWI